jgi:hypothetical protein
MISRGDVAVALLRLFVAAYAVGLVALAAWFIKWILGRLV